MSSELKTPIRPDDVRRFNVGDVVYISGVIYHGEGQGTR